MMRRILTFFVFFLGILLVSLFVRPSPAQAQCGGVNYTCGSTWCITSRQCILSGSVCVPGSCPPCEYDYNGDGDTDDPTENESMSVYVGCAGGTPEPTPAGCGTSCSCLGGGVYPLDCESMCDAGLTCSAGGPAPATGICDAAACNPTPTTPPCIPSCSPACGQANGCGGWCTNSSNVWGACSGGQQFNPCVGYRACSVIQARAKAISSSSTSCADVAASSTYIGSVTMSTSPSLGAAQTTDGSASYLSWDNAAPNTYTLISAPPAAYILRAACWSTGVSSGTGMSAAVTPGTTLVWELGYSYGSPWFQAEGGEVYGATDVSSAVSAITTPREFILEGDGGYPGVATYGTSYDFDADLLANGETYVSSTNWLVNEVFDPVDYYQVFYKRFGAPIDPDVFFNLADVTKPASRPTPYYVQGDMTTSGNWTVGDGEMIVFLVDGDLTINGSINIAGANNTGFIAFIVNGDITVSPTVGNPLATTTPNLEGIYITSQTGTFHSGASTSAGNERLVVEGTVVAGNVLLERDLDSIGGNPLAPSELFIYNPQLLITMPDAMRDVPIKWEEVAP